MANYTAQNNSRDAASNVNTRGYQFMNKNGFDPSTLTVGYWNEMVSIKVNPALDPNSQTADKVFDYDKTVSTSLTLEKAMTMLYKITKDIIPAISNNEDKSVAVQVAGDTIVVVGTGKRLTNDIRPFLAIHKSVNPDTKIPEMSIFYEFKTSDSIDDYDETKGTYTMYKGIPSEFNLFVEFLKSAVVGLSNAATHSGRVVNRWKNDKLENTVNAIAEKVGASTQHGNSYGNNYRRNVSWGSQSNNSDNAGPTQSVSELSNMSDIDEYLN